MAKKKEFKAPSRRQPCYKFLKIFMRMLFKRPEILNLNDEPLAEKSIVLANHSAKSGPPSLDLYYPMPSVKWGAHQMVGKFKERKAYLRDVLYIQKMGMKPGFRTSFKATMLALLAPFPYKGMHVLGTYTDGRFTNTLRKSVVCLDANYSVMLYPENSNEGYKDVLTEFFPGFIMLADKYYRLRGEDLPVYPVYLSIKKRFMVIGKPMYVQDFVKQGKNREEIAQMYCDAVNQLYYDYVEKRPDVK